LPAIVNPDLYTGPQLARQVAIEIIETT